MGARISVVAATVRALRRGRRRTVHPAYSRLPLELPVAGRVVASLAARRILAQGSLVPGLILIYLGIGPSVSLSPDLIVQSAPTQRAGSAASLSESATELSVALGITLMGSLGAAVYRARMEAPPAVGDAARESRRRGRERYRRPP